MSESTIQALTKRVDQLEVENRRLKVAATLGALVVAGVAMMGALPNTVQIATQKVIIRAPDGTERAILDAAGLSLYNDRRQLTARLTSNGEMDLFDDGRAPVVGSVILSAGPSPSFDMMMSSKANLPSGQTATLPLLMH